jgi:RNA polymerase sigma-70 factor, ECF subfamily
MQKDAAAIRAKMHPNITIIVDPKKIKRQLNSCPNYYSKKNIYISKMKNQEADFQNIYNQYHILVYNAALNYLQNIEDAEEITQDVFVQVYASLHRFQDKSSQKTWIYRITINKCLDFIKHKNSKKRFFIFGKKSQNESEYLNSTTFEHPGVLLENKEYAVVLYETINQLPENQKTAFILSKIDGQSNSEIANIMQLSLSSIESLIFRAKSALREKLALKFETYRKKK